MVELDDAARVRSVWDDALERDGQILVLCGNEVSLLSPVATELALTVRDGMTVGALGDHLVDVFGEPAGRDRGTAVRDMLTSLMARGVIVIDRA